MNAKIDHIIQWSIMHISNTLRPIQNGCIFADNIFKRILLNQNVWISITISLKFVPKGDDLAPNRRQAIIWNNDGLISRHIYASPGLNGVNEAEPP